MKLMSNNNMSEISEELLEKQFNIELNHEKIM